MKTMTAEEYNVVNKIARKTKADCWFLIKQTDDGEDFVCDLEEGKAMSLADGISALAECIDCKENYEACCLTADEEKTLGGLLSKLNISLAI